MENVRTGGSKSQSNAEVDERDEREASMDFDGPWLLLDQIPFISNPMSPFLSPSSFDFPSSPLWGFPGDKDENPALSATASPAAAASTQFISNNPDSAAESQTGNEDKSRAVTPLLGLRALENSDGSCVIRERMMQALRYFKESSEQHVLAQFWSPIKSGGRYVLTTSGQPFVLDTHSNGLHQYRMVSLMFMFPADEDSNGEPGLPGRVFQQKLPEWTPNVQYYSCKEYPRRNHALSLNVQGTLALPVFEPFGLSCIGVLELIMTRQKINYAPDVDKVCKALEAVNLKSSEILERSSTQICNIDRQNALAEILEILTVACETHKLPLAQTWVPCRHRNILADGGGLKKSCSSFDGSCMGQLCMSTIDTAFYVVDARIWGFREACAEHHLQKGQGVAGKAFSSHNACFCSDVTQFGKMEYPLAHYAQLFGLTSCLAICLSSSHTGNDRYILEFFLPPNIRDSRDQETLLQSLLATMQQHFRSLEVVGSVKELGGQIPIEVVKSSTDAELHSTLEFITMPQASTSPPGSDVLPESGNMLAKTCPVANELMVEFDVLKCGGDVGSGGHKAVSVSERKDTQKAKERKRGKAEKSISLEILQNYFAGSLKEAAKSLGVCPTTMKRICRQHGISRWPSRKIKKVNRSLSKLKCVIESVHGVEGAIDLTAFTTGPLTATVGSIPLPANLEGAKPLDLGRVNSEMNACKRPESKEQDVALGHEELIHEHSGSGFLQIRSKMERASREESSGTPTSPGSCHSSPANDTAPANVLFISPPCENHVEGGGSLEFLFQGTLDMNSFAEPSIHKKPLGEMLVGDAGSSKDLRNHPCPASNTLFDEQSSPGMAPEEPVDAFTISSRWHGQDVKSVTIKATYKEDMVRFKISPTSGVVVLQEEVAKRLKLEVGTFEIKYLDDDREWVLVACDADLEECIDVSRSSSSGRNIVRLWVHDIMPNLGSSCGSSCD